MRIKNKIPVILALISNSFLTGCSNKSINTEDINTIVNNISTEYI